MNLPVMLDLAHREIPDVQSVVVRQGESGALTLKIAIVENKKPFDLTGCEAYLKAARPDGAVISQPCTIEQPTKGCVSYTLPPEIAGVVGKISLAHVEIRKSDTLIATTDDLSILVRPRVDMDAAEANSVVSEIDALKELLHGIIDDGSAQLESQSSEFATLKSDSQAATTAANTAAANADTAAANADTAAANADTAAANADTAAANADTAAANADTAAANADTAAANADTAAANADTAAANADTAAANADESTAASAIQTAACAAATDAAMEVATSALSKRRADTLYANAIIGNAQGDMVHVEDAWEADAVGLGVLGKSAQVVTTGKNLVAVRLPSKTNAGITYIKNSDGSITLSGTATSDAYFRIDQADGSASNLANYSGTYTLSGGGTGPVMRLMRASDFASIIEVRSATPTTKTFTEVNCFFDIAVPNGTTVNTTYYPQLELGSTATSYEPYTGGEPSPSPDYPQEVDVVDSPVSVQVVGKNLFNVADKLYGNISFSTNESGIRLSGKSTVQWTGVNNKVAMVGLSGKTCILSCSALPPEAYVSVSFLDINGITLRMRDINAWTATVITPVVIPEKTISIMFNVGVRTLGTELDVVVKPQFELGSTATTYEPYTSTQQTITLPSDHNYLASLPDGTRDELVLRSDGVAVLTKRIFHTQLAVADMNNIENYPGWSSVTGLSEMFPDVLDRVYGISSIKGMGAYYAVNTRNAPSSKILYLPVLFFGMTQTEWKATYPDLVIDFYLKATTPQTMYSADNGATWTATDPNAGNSAIQLHKGTNNVWCTDPLSPEVGLDYVQDTNAVINELRAAIVASGATS